MIVDTSAIAAIAIGERGCDQLLEAVLTEQSFLPAPAQAEFQRVAALRGPGFDAVASDLLLTLERAGLEIIPFDRTHAFIAAQANAAFGKGNGRGGLLNLIDLMVYAVAKQRQQPLLCTGRDFASTDIAIHPASRIDG